MYASKGADGKEDQAAAPNWGAVQAGLAQIASAILVLVAEPDPLLAPIPGADHREVVGVEVDVVPAGEGRVKRAIYPPGHRWSERLRDVVGTDLCMHAHVGFLARGRIEGEYRDGCRFAYEAPAALVIEPGHDAWVVGDEPAVLIEFDYEKDTARRFGLPDEHRH